MKSFNFKFDGSTILGKAILLKAWLVVIITTQLEKLQEAYKERKRKREWGPDKQLYYLKQTLLDDYRWLAHNEVASALTERYLSIVRDGWEKRVIEPPDRFREKLGLSPKTDWQKREEELKDETAYLLSSPNNAERLKQSSDQVKKGACMIHELIKPNKNNDKSLVELVPHIDPQHPYEAYRRQITKLAEEEGGGFMITFPQLPGCMSDGETEEEAIENGKDAFSAWVSARIAAGKEIPTP